MSLVTNPAGLHHMLNLTHEPVVGRYLDDLAAAMKEAGRSGATAQAVDARY